jgi:hypothetical protein
LRLQGEQGGPRPGEGEPALAQGGDLTLWNSGHPVIVDRLPPALENLPAKSPLFVFVSTDRYLLFCTVRSASEISSRTLNNSISVYVHDRTKDRWETIQTEGTSSTLRLFGEWLAEIVANGNPNHSPNPGRDNERTWDEQTDTLPPVQRLYEEFGSEESARPGILVLQNLADGRKVRIETDQEDSEIIWADADSLLYRVNDAIYRARIAGDKVEDKTMMVQDEDVPEIHWAFWSK